MLAALDVRLNWWRHRSCVVARSSCSRRLQVSKVLPEGITKGFKPWSIDHGLAAVGCMHRPPPSAAMFKETFCTRHVTAALKERDGFVWPCKSLLAAIANKTGQLTNTDKPARVQGDLAITGSLPSTSAFHHTHSDMPANCAPGIESPTARVQWPTQFFTITLFRYTKLQPGRTQGLPTQVGLARRFMHTPNGKSQQTPSASQELNPPTRPDLGTRTAKQNNKRRHRRALKKAEQQLPCIAQRPLPDNLPADTQLSQPKVPSSPDSGRNSQHTGLHSEKGQASFSGRHPQAAHASSTAARNSAREQHTPRTHMTTGQTVGQNHQPQTNSKHQRSDNLIINGNPEHTVSTHETLPRLAQWTNSQAAPGSSAAFAAHRSGGFAGPVASLSDPQHSMAQLANLATALATNNGPFGKDNSLRWQHLAEQVLHCHTQTLQAWTRSNLGKLSPSYQLHPSSSWDHPNAGSRVDHMLRCWAEVLEAVAAAGCAGEPYIKLCKTLAQAVAAGQLQSADVSLWARLVKAYRVLCYGPKDLLDCLAKQKLAGIEFENQSLDAWLDILQDNKRIGRSGVVPASPMALCKHVLEWVQPDSDDVSCFRHAAGLVSLCARFKLKPRVLLNAVNHKIGKLYLADKGTSPEGVVAWLNDLDHMRRHIGRDGQHDVLNYVVRGGLDGANISTWASFLKALDRQKIAVRDAAFVNHVIRQAVIEKGLASADVATVVEFVNAFSRLPNPADQPTMLLCLHVSKLLHQGVLEDATAHQLIRLLMAYARMRYYDDTVIEHLVQCITNKDVARYGPGVFGHQARQLMKVWNAVAKLGYDGPAVSLLLDPLTDANNLHAFISCLDWYDCMSCLQGLAIMNMLHFADGKLTNVLVENANYHWQNGSGHAVKQYMMRVNHFATRFSRADDLDVSAGRLHRVRLMQGLSAWVALQQSDWQGKQLHPDMIQVGIEVAARETAGDSAPSEIGKRITSCLKQLVGSHGISGVTPEYTVPEINGLVMVDFLVDMEDGEQKVIEVDGWSHLMINDPMRRTGATQFRDRLLAGVFGAHNVLHVVGWDEDLSDAELEGKLLCLLGLSKL